MVDRFFSEPELAELYDTLSADRDDLRFYLPLVLSARSVLDVGCGTGELLHMARESGHTGRLCGLDPAGAMLAQARRRRPHGVEWVLGDLRDHVWDGEFELAVMTGHAFQVLLDDAELRSALAAVRACLVPGGRFAFETRHPAARAWERWIPEYEVEFTGPHGDVLRSRYETEAAPQAGGGLVTFTHTVTGPGGERPRTSRSTLRFLGAQELSSFLAEAGLTVAEQYGDWDGSPLTGDGPEIVTVAVRS
ncbi:class I SAM-dependent methyltransferase [Streptomyces nanshensis]|uniref:Methyltransferase n=1 Tax=Streptomyces nanshensis TaxID=518642 RepID=A0A1E7L2F0_9ACTN|nr:class I SAM-dependent methyltransferase [Streptomyces nanshensis]OEV10360.1 methyltransferase [Streptomyces nanshensis]